MEARPRCHNADRPSLFSCCFLSQSAVLFCSGRFPRQLFQALRGLLARVQRLALRPAVPQPLRAPAAHVPAARGRGMHVLSELGRAHLLLAMELPFFKLFKALLLRESPPLLVAVSVSSLASWVWSVCLSCVSGLAPLLFLCSPVFLGPGLSVSPPPAVLPHVFSMVVQLIPSSGRLVLRLHHFSVWSACAASWGSMFQRSLEQGLLGPFQHECSPRRCV